MYDKIIRFLAAGLGLGYVPLAPGTFGTVLGSLLYYLLRSWLHADFIRFVGVFALFSILVAHLAEKSFKSKDCQKIVIDEVAGVLVAYAFVPFSFFHLVLGFILFRVFDVAKIFPAREAQDRIPGGAGVVGDDLVAGAQAGLILLLLPRLQIWAAQFFHLFDKI